MGVQVPMLGVSRVAQQPASLRRSEAVASSDDPVASEEQLLARSR